MTPLLAPRVHPDHERSFERLYRKHVRDVYGYALGMLGNPADAEDVTQTTFLNAYRALSRGERIENARGWLLAIAQNVCRQRFRTASRRPQEVSFDPELIEAFAPDDAPAADEIRAAMLQLAFNQRAVLVLREIEGRSYAEIAEAMGISVSAVETLLFRARRALREQLEATERPLSCEETEVFVSRQLDGRLARHERGRLRAHLRSCPGCAAYARSQRAQTKAVKSLGGITLPAGLAGALGWSLGGGAAAKAAALLATVAVIGTGVAVGTGAVPDPWKALGQRHAAAPPPAPPAAAPAKREEAVPPPAAPEAAELPSAGAPGNAPEGPKPKAAKAHGHGKPAGPGEGSRGQAHGKKPPGPPGQAVKAAKVKPKPAQSAQGPKPGQSAQGPKPAQPAQGPKPGQSHVKKHKPGAGKESGQPAAKKPSPSPLLGQNPP